MSRQQPGSNELLDDEPTLTAADFERLVEQYGRGEASRRWMALVAATDAAPT